MKKCMEILKNNRGFSFLEMAAAITVIAILACFLTPGILRIVDNTEKSSDCSNANQLVKATIQTCIFDERYYGFKGDIDINDGEQSEMEQAVVSRLSLIPRLKSQRNCHYIIRIESLGSIQILDDQNRMIFPDMDDIYKRQ